jgi:hypothetical protein
VLRLIMTTFLQVVCGDFLEHVEVHFIKSKGEILLRI